MIGCIIQARMGSTRLPGKVLMELDLQNTVLDFVISQIKHCKNCNKIIIATTNLSEDDEIESLALKNQIQCFRGNSTDVLDRFYQCAKKFQITDIIRVTADNPLIDPTLVDQVIEKFEKEKYDYVNNFIPRTFPYGTEVEIFSFKTLEVAWINAEKPSEREHVTPYIYNNTRFNIASIKNSKDLSNLRWTVDHKNDFELVKKIISKTNDRPILLDKILKIIETEPSIIQINKDNIPNEGYIKSLKEDNFIKK